MNTLRRASLLRFAAAACTLSLAASLAPNLLAQRPDRAVTPAGVAISPDGALVTYTTGGRRGGGALHVVSVADPTSDKILAPTGPAGCSSEDPVWSPDSQTLAVLSTCADAKQGQQEILLWSRATGEFKQLTHLTGAMHEMAFSPDGKSIAFLFVENATRSAGALDAMPPWDGVIGEDHVEIQRIYAVDTATGKGEWVTPEKLHVYEFGWSPNSEKIAFTAANPPGENTWWIAKIFVADSLGKNSGTNAPTVVFDPNTSKSAMHGLQIAVPRFSPDGTKIAFIGGLMSDQGSTGGDVWVVPSKGGEPTDVTPGIDGTPCFEAWLSNDIIGMVEDRSGHTVLPDYKVSTHSLIPGSAIDLGEVTISGGSVKDAITFSPSKALLAFAMTGFNTAPEVYLVDGMSQKVTALTHLNTGAKPAGRTESVEWENDGFHIQGWLTYPENYDPHKKYPLIVTVHGGPSASVGSRWGGGNWAQYGYFEFQPNPRGSFGQGEAFVQANRKDFGYGDLHDILKGMDMLESKFPIDKHREGLTGWSYGGFMSMFAETQTTRFATIIAGAGISDWKSYYGENSIDQWMIPFFGASVYDDPAVYAKSSAIEFIKQAKTPMLIIVGDRDGECPAPQSFEMWHALRAEGVKTQLVIYPNEGHGFRDPAHIKDRMDREVKWFAEYMPKGSE